jgi:hypothetical protein
MHTCDVAKTLLLISRRFLAALQVRNGYEGPSAPNPCLRIEEVMQRSSKHGNQCPYICVRVACATQHNQGGGRWGVQSIGG